MQTSADIPILDLHSGRAASGTAPSNGAAFAAFYSHYSNTAFAYDGAYRVPESLTLGQLAQYGLKLPASACQASKPRVQTSKLEHCNDAPGIAQGLTSKIFSARTQSPTFRRSHPTAALQLREARGLGSRQPHRFFVRALAARTIRRGRSAKLCRLTTLRAQCGETVVRCTIWRGRRQTAMHVYDERRSIDLASKSLVGRSAARAGGTNRTGGHGFAGELETDVDGTPQPDGVSLVRSTLARANL